MSALYPTITYYPRLSIICFSPSVSSAHCPISQSFKFLLSSMFQPSFPHPSYHFGCLGIFLACHIVDNTDAVLHWYSKSFAIPEMDPCPFCKLIRKVLHEYNLIVHNPSPERAPIWQGHLLCEPHRCLQCILYNDFIPHACSSSPRLESYLQCKVMYPCLWRLKDWDNQRKHNSTYEITQLLFENKLKS